MPYRVMHTSPGAVQVTNTEASSPSKPSVSHGRGPGSDQSRKTGSRSPPPQTSTWYESWHIIKEGRSLRVVTSLGHGDAESDSEVKGSDKPQKVLSSQAFQSRVRMGNCHLGEDSSHLLAGTARDTGSRN